MRAIVSEKDATAIVRQEMGEVLMAAAYARNAPPRTQLVVAGETFVVEKGGKLRGVEREPFAGTASVRKPAAPELKWVRTSGKVGSVATDRIGNSHPPKPRKTAPPQ
jgi:hypothetical protein